MKILPINIKKNEKSKDYNNVYSFTLSTNQELSEISYNSIDYNKEIEKIIGKKKYQKYTLTLDWLQFIARQENDINYHLFTHEEIKLNPKDSNNPNFSSCYMVNVNETEICELYVYPTNKKFESDEVSIKICNNLLYTNNYHQLIFYVLSQLGLVFIRLFKLDIALDSHDNEKIMKYLKRYIRTKTILFKNDNLKPNGQSFIKQELNFKSYSFGSRKYQKTFTVYNKTKEIKKSGKNYISKFWETNSLDNIEKDIFRFELQLGTRHLKKYDLKDICMISDTKLIGDLFKNEVSNYFKLYQVKLKDIKRYRKDVAIKKGREIKLFDWKRIPKGSHGLQIVDIKTNPQHQAKRSITFALDILIQDYSDNVTTTGSTVDFISTVSNNYDLSRFTINKIMHKLGQTKKLNGSDKSFLFKQVNEKVNEKTNPG